MIKQGTGGLGKGRATEISRGGGGGGGGVGVGVERITKEIPPWNTAVVYQGPVSRRSR